jgi:hypothetical protein
VKSEKMFGRFRFPCLFLLQKFLVVLSLFRATLGLEQKRNQPEPKKRYLEQNV